jgi:hypothetical protein
MAKSYMSMKYEEFKDRFSKFWQHRKKVKALENYSQVNDFPGVKYIPMLKELLADGFLDDEEEKFLEYQIKKAEIDAYSWCYRTKWLKSEMARLSASKAKRPEPQLYFDLDKVAPTPVHIPFELLAQQGKMQGARV